MAACDGCARDYNQPHKNDCAYYGEGGMIDIMATTDEKIHRAIAVECDRQHVGEDRREFLYIAYKNLQKDKSTALLALILKSYAAFIEPDNHGVYRTTPVTFDDVVGGVPPESIERSMAAWIDWFNFERPVHQDVADQIIKEFLDIHPFIDGNGRIAWLLRVWMLNQWDDPQPLPDYFGEN
jgi:hypothetical protein